MGRPSLNRDPSVDPACPRPDLVEAGRRLLGALLDDAALYHRIRGELDAPDFSDPLDQAVFDAIGTLIRRNQTVDGTTVAAHLNDIRYDAEGGIGAYLDALLACAAPADEVPHLARRLAGRSAEAGNSLYHRDVVAWSHRQARRLGELAARTDDLSREVDWDNLIDEVLSVGRSQTAGVARKIELVLAHLLKILSDPDAPSRRHWRHEIDVWRLRIGAEFTPSMRRLLDLDHLWGRAIAEARRDLDEYGIRLVQPLPATCPLGLDDLLDEAATMDALLSRMAVAISASPRKDPP
ncbi:DUF29 family protein [uncultured Methylobacterium sp.]|jgi:hypothetical protein|uniref:DUF29 family protein n=1 Tax=uncultured Methylobacterium sp. TaxID=157278 RepID=UPI0026118DF9|nr:DUF29 family protein [uncultured Methylobacterium sp.]